MNCALQISMRISGYRYITRENLGRFLRHPSVLVSGVVLFALLALYSLADRVSVIYLLYSETEKHKGPGVTDTFRFTMRRTGDLLKEKGRIHILFNAFFEEFYASGAMLFVLVQTSLLKEIFRVIFGDWRLLAPWLILIIAGGIACLFLSGIVPEMLFDGVSHREALRRITKRKTGDTLRIGLYYIVIQLLYFGVFLLTMGVSIFIAFRLQGVIRRLVSFSLGRVFIVCTVMTVEIVLFGIMNGGITFFLMAPDRKKSIKPPAPLSEEAQRRIPALCVITVIAVMAFTGLHTFNAFRGRYNPNIELVHTMEITAHRGASRYYPENTMAAFEAAVSLGTDWIELDIQQSKDGQLFVMHDAGFGRTCGVNAKSWELDSEQIRTMDAGRKFGQAFEGEPVPFLEDVIDYAKSVGVRLNIELKPTEQQEGMEENLVRMLQEKNFIGDCVVTSQKYSSLKKVKELDPTITTVYVMSLAYGNLVRLDAADAFSIHMGSVTDRVVSNVHNAGKQIFAWTVNKRNDMEVMMDRRVDNIITDDISLARNCVGMARTGDEIWIFIRWVRRILTV